MNETSKYFHVKDEIEISTTVMIIFPAETKVKTTTRNKKVTNDETMICKMHTKRLRLTNIKHKRVEYKFLFCNI